MSATNIGKNATNILITSTNPKQTQTDQSILHV